MTSKKQYKLWDIIGFILMVGLMGSTVLNSIDSLKLFAVFSFLWIFFEIAIHMNREKEDEIKEELEKEQETKK